MNLPTKHQDVWVKATQQDIIVALSRLSILQSRQIEPGTEEVARDAMYRGLAGVTKYGLEKAIDAVLQNKLGHGFFPSPPELRGLCDKAMEHHVSMRDRIQRQEKLDRERIPARREPTPEERARVKAKYEAFCGSFKGPEPKPEFDWSSVNDRFDREAAE